MKSLGLYIALILFSGNIYASFDIEELKDLNPTINESVKGMRADIRKAVFVVKSRRPEIELPVLKFYAYSVKKNETFWSILAKTSLDIDTLVSVNSIATPSEVVPGKRLYLPNMRGIIMHTDNPKKIFDIMSSCKIKPEYVYKANKIDKIEKKHIFIPCGKISSTERSLFLGSCFINPLSRVRLTSGFGLRKNPFDPSQKEFHSGLDVACDSGTKIYAARHGRVIFSGYEQGYGRLVVIEHEMGYRTYYGHLSRCLAVPGQSVERGEIIGISGNTGRTTGPHLHFEIRKNGVAVNPALKLRS
jgi:hypothetical protein